MNLTHLKQDRTAQQAIMDGLMAAADKDNRPLSAAEIASFDAAEAKFNELTATIDRGERALKASGKTETVPAAGRQPAQVHNNQEDAPFRDFGEMLLCVRDAAVQPSAIDPRLHKRAALGANEKVGSEGGFLVGTDVSSELLEEMHDVGIVAPLCSEVPISNNSNGIEINGVDETSRANGSRFGGVQAYWADEAGTATATKPKFKKLKLKLNKLLALYYATEEELADASVLGTLATKAFGEEMAFKVDDGIIRGTGAGMPMGVLNSGAVVSVAKEVGQAAGTIVYENITKMFARMPARSKRNGVWYVNDDTLPQLMTMTIIGGTASTPVFLPPNGAASAPFGTLMGRPIMPIEQCETVGTVGDIIFADFSQYKLATKGAVQQAQSIHVQFLTAEQVFRFIYRVDGQPARSAPMTPFKGTATQSPFVTLATR